MKKTLPKIFLLMLIWGSAHAQKNTIKANPVSPVLGIPNISYERFITPKTSLQIGVYSLALTHFIAELYGASSYGITPEIRYYPNKEKAGGLFLGAYYRHQYFHITDAGIKEDLIFNSGGALAGYRWLVSDDEMLFDVFAGLGVKSIYYTNISGGQVLKGNEIFLGNGGLIMRLGINFGIPF